MWDSLAWPASSTVSPPLKDTRSFPASYPGRSPCCSLTWLPRLSTLLPDSYAQNVQKYSLLPGSNLGQCPPVYNIHLLPFIPSGPPFFSLTAVCDLSHLHIYFLAPGYERQPLCSLPTGPPNQLQYVSWKHLLWDALTADNSCLLQKSREQDTTGGWVFHCPGPFNTMWHKVQGFCQPGYFPMCWWELHFTCLEKPPIYGALRSKQGQKENWLTHCDSKVTSTKIGREHGDHRKWNFRFSVWCSIS